jgi:hypothetical protein
VGLLVLWRSEEVQTLSVKGAAGSSVQCRFHSTAGIPPMLCLCNVGSGCREASDRLGCHMIEARLGSYSLPHPAERCPDGPPPPPAATCRAAGGEQRRRGHGCLQRQLRGAPTVPPAATRAWHPFTLAPAPLRMLRLAGWPAWPLPLKPKPCLATKHSASTAILPMQAVTRSEHQKHLPYLLSTPGLLSGHRQQGD